MRQYKRVAQILSDYSRRRWKDAKTNSFLFRSRLKSCCCTIVKPSSVKLAHHRPAIHAELKWDFGCTYSEYSWQKFSISRVQKFLGNIHRLQTSDRCLSPQNRNQNKQRPRHAYCKLLGISCPLGPLRGD